MPHLLAQYDFDLPKNLIAQHPLPERDRSRLMVLARGRAGASHHVFHELPGLLPADALLVVNNTRVLPHKLVGHLAGGVAVEALLLEAAGPGQWRAMVKRGRRLKPGSRILFAQGRIAAEAVCRNEAGHWVLRFEEPATLPERLERDGLAPLPPYIRRNGDSPLQAAQDRADYQTCFARIGGAIAAPTAGRHFVPALLEQLREKGVGIVQLTLHVGLGTFSPVKAENPDLHKMHREWYDLPQPAAAEILRARREGRPVIAVGTTAVRALESWAGAGCPPGSQGWAELFIRPPYRFQAVDGLITNFHQPRSTLLMLVAAFHGLEPLLGAYREAIARRYRFYSFGDAMAILP